MNITLITGSPRKKGTTALLADEFMRGAKEAGHEVFRFDAAHEKLSPCLGCDACRQGNRCCVHRDGMDQLNPALLASGAVVFVTPLYYFGMTTQLKTVIDRFYANNSALMKKPMIAALLCACADEDASVLDALVAHYKTILDYLGWKDAGRVLATGCWQREDIARTAFPAMAYELGKTFGA
ncbi:MAG TPA: flavodoxin family protein [Clostridia bacterium]|nr:flavodoxin family protein [Clostridia bacterium]